MPPEVSGRGRRAAALTLALSSALTACASDDAAEDGPATGGAPGRSECRPRDERGTDGLCRCPANDVLCPTAGYAHFVVSNVEDSGLPNEATYEIGEGVVRDVVTGLFWEQAPSTEYFGWADAKARCAALELGGRDDFRLPGRIELVTILDFGRLPVVVSPLPETEFEYYWTSSPVSFVEGSAYTVYFGAGETAVARADPGRAVSRCVAGAVSPVEEPQFRIEDDMAVDRATGLAWERTAGAPATLDDAGARCAALGMRLPSVRELQSIIDESRHMPAIDPTVFPGAESVAVWSSTFRGDAPWYVDFEDGQTYADLYPEDLAVSRCVR